MRDIDEGLLTVALRLAMAVAYTSTDVRNTWIDNNSIRDIGEVVWISL